jgi:hypothetical protein
LPLDRLPAVLLQKLPDVLPSDPHIGLVGEMAGESAIVIGW